MMEKFANNYTSIMIARMAMMVTPLLLSFFIWLFWQVYTGLETRVTTLEDTKVAQALILQDHESRLVFGRGQREAFESRTKEEFANIDAGMRELQREMGNVNGSIIRLQAVVENRLPPRSGSLEEPPR